MSVPAASAQSRQYAHGLIDRMALKQLVAVIGLLEIVVDPLSYSLDSAPYEDESISEEEIQAVANSKAWLKENDPIPNEVLLAEFGLTAQDFERMGRTPIGPHDSGQ